MQSSQAAIVATQLNSHAMHKNPRCSQVLLRHNSVERLQRLHFNKGSTLHPLMWRARAYSDFAYVLARLMDACLLAHRTTVTVVNVFSLAHWCNERAKLSDLHALQVLCPVKDRKFLGHATSQPLHTPCANEDMPSVHTCTYCCETLLTREHCHTPEASSSNYRSTTKTAILRENTESKDASRAKVHADASPSDY